MKLVVFLLFAFVVFGLSMAEESKCSGPNCEQIISMPLLDNMEASLKADVDVRKLKTVLESFIRQVVKKEVKDVIREDMRTIMNETVSNVESLFDDRMNEMKLDLDLKVDKLIKEKEEKEMQDKENKAKLQQKIDSLDTKLVVIQKQINCNTKLRCEDGWELYNKHCYKFVREKETREKAQAKCNDESAALVKIDDALEDSFIYSSGGLPNTYVPGEGHFEVYWTSGIRSGKTNWVWSVDGTPFSYDNFGSYEPNNTGGRENCINLTNDGKWNDISCSSHLFYICEKQA